MVGVRPDRVDHEGKSISAFDLAHFGIGHYGPDELGVGEVREPAHTPRVAVLHPRHRIRWELRPREQEGLAQAFDLNARTGRSARNNLESLVEWVPRPRQCHPCEQLQNRGNCGCFKPGLTYVSTSAMPSATRALWAGVRSAAGVAAVAVAGGLAVRSGGDRAKCSRNVDAEFGDASGAHGFVDSELPSLSHNMLLQNQDTL